MASFGFMLLTNYLAGTLNVKLIDTEGRLPAKETQCDIMPIALFIFIHIKLYGAKICE